MVAMAFGWGLGGGCLPRCSSYLSNINELTVNFFAKKYVFLAFFYLEICR